MVLVPLLLKSGELKAKETFASAVAIIFPSAQYLSSPSFSFCGLSLASVGALSVGGAAGGLIGRQTVPQNAAAVAQAHFCRVHPLRRVAVSHMTQGSDRRRCRLWHRHRLRFRHRRRHAAAVGDDFVFRRGRPCGPLHQPALFPAHRPWFPLLSQEKRISQKEAIRSAILPGVALAVAGAVAAAFVDTQQLRKAFGLYLLWAGVSVLWPKKEEIGGFPLGGGAFLEEGDGLRPVAGGVLLLLEEGERLRPTFLFLSQEKKTCRSPPSASLRSVALRNAPAGAGPVQRKKSAWSGFRDESCSFFLCALRPGSGCLGAMRTGFTFAPLPLTSAGGQAYALEPVAFVAKAASFPLCLCPDGGFPDAMRIGFSACAAAAEGCADGL